MPKVSVVIPCYNQGVYLDEAVDSVLAQTYGDFEIIVINDGSTDEFTNRLLAGYGKPGTRIVTTRNQGPAAARNAGIRESLGDYILPLDADDRIGPCYLEKAVKVLETNPDIGIVYCLGELFGAGRGPVAAPDFSVGKMLLSNLIFASALFRKEDWEKTGGYNPNMTCGCEDWDFWLSIIELPKNVFRIPEVLFFYRIKDVSRNTSMDAEKQLDMHMRLMKNHKDLYIDHARSFFRLYYAITGSRIYRLLKKTGLLRLIQRIIKF
jgi:glycosyltransferase involved in cell wall biosynthesis